MKEHPNLSTTQEATNLTELDNVDVVNPANTKLELEESQMYIDSILNIESHLQERVNHDVQVQVGEFAAIDPAHVRPNCTESTDVANLDSGWCEAGKDDGCRNLG